MKAIALKPGTKDVALTDIEEPVITGPRQVKIRVLQVGICGTDREQVEGGRSDAPLGKDRLVIGHEMFGVVVETGKEVEGIRVGEHGLFSVRRGCGRCEACMHERSDMCFTGDYTERGIKAADGFQSEYVVDEQKYFIPVPEEIMSIGVLGEPMSVAAKAIDEAVKIQSARLGEFTNTDNWLQGKTALVAGIGAIGLLAAIALRLKGAEVIGLDVVEENTLRPQLLKAIGGRYVDGRNVPVMDFDDKVGEVDLVFEAAGVAELQVNLIDVLAVNAVYVATGIPSGNRPATVAASDLMKQLVLKNQLVVGSVNASIEHFRMGIGYLREGNNKWPGVLQQLITRRVAYQNFGESIHNHGAGDIKVVVEWAPEK
ncbi:MAG: alcohol dehydrogenase [Chitinophagaceae bacterium]|nr:MAG: alcohol dehydrogenase [Chitinophagaceae bacterium]